MDEVYLKLKQADAQKIFNFLVTCPYMQVAELVAIMQSLPKIETDEKAAE